MRAIQRKKENFRIAMKFSNKIFSYILHTKNYKNTHVTLNSNTRSMDCGKWI